MELCLAIHQTQLCEAFGRLVQNVIESPHSKFESNEVFEEQSQENLPRSKERCKSKYELSKSDQAFL